MSTRIAALLTCAGLAACGAAPATAPRTVAPAEDSVRVSTCLPSTFSRTPTSDSCVDRMDAAPEHRVTR
ncbi:MAG: hypothetical protein K8W52_40785 [Deltaproteobacteria bacterium]|nr:hypothetical protein [Deltaproteobacteria bacterium]